MPKIEKGIHIPPGALFIKTDYGVRISKPSQHGGVNLNKEWNLIRLLEMQDAMGYKLDPKDG